MSLHITVVILTARDAGRLQLILGQKRKANVDTFLADKNQWMVLVYKVLDPTSEHRVKTYTASTVTAPIDLFLTFPAVVSNSAAFFL